MENNTNGSNDQYGRNPQDQGYKPSNGNEGKEALDRSSESSQRTPETDSDPNRTASSDNFSADSSRSTRRSWDSDDMGIDDEASLSPDSDADRSLETDTEDENRTPGL